MQAIIPRQILLIKMWPWSSEVEGARAKFQGRVGSQDGHVPGPHWAERWPDSITVFSLFYFKKYAYPTLQNSNYVLYMHWLWRRFFQVIDAWLGSLAVNLFMIHPVVTEDRKVGREWGGGVERGLKPNLDRHSHRCTKRTLQVKVPSWQ